jgi:hypothetical protein
MTAMTDGAAGRSGARAARRVPAPAAIADIAETCGVTDGKAQPTTEIEGGVDRHRDVHARTLSVAQNGSPAHSPGVFD